MINTQVSKRHMHKSFFTVLAFFSLISGQDITVSKDSIMVYNNPLSSYADEVTFTSRTSTPVHLDSAFIAVSEMDTAGLSYIIAQNGLEASWTGNTQPAQYYLWYMDSAGQNTWKLRSGFAPSFSGPLIFSGTGSTSQISRLQIGYCFICDRMPVFPLYFKGTMRLFFSNGQVIELRLYSYDLRTAVRHRDFVVRKDNLHNGNVRYLANGRRVGAGAKTLLRKDPAIRTYLPDKGR